MTPLRLLTLLLLSLHPLSANAQSQALLSTVSAKDNAVPPGIAVVPPGYNDRDQWVIPRYANGKTHPAGQIVGWGPGSVVRGTAKTSTLPIPAVVVTEDWGQPMAQWQAGAVSHPEFKAAVLQPVLRDVTVAGYDVGGDTYTGNGAVGDNPALTHAKTPDAYDGLRWQASGGRCENVNWFGIPGTAASFSRGWGWKNGQTLPFDNAKLQLRNLNATRCFRGFNINVVDAVVGPAQGSSLRDYGIKFTAGATQIDGALHFWGVFAGPAVWFYGSNNWGGPIYAESSKIGCQIDSKYNRIGPFYSWNCFQCCLQINQSHNIVHDFQIKTQHDAGENENEEVVTAVEINNQYNMLADGLVTISDANDKGVMLRSNATLNTVINSVRINGPGIGKGVGIDSDTPLKDAWIVVDVRDIGTAIDLNDNGVSRIGTGNFIWLTTHTDPGETSTVTTPIDLPPRWDSRTNQIWIDGVRQTSQ